MDPNIAHDPVFQDLLVKHELAGRKLRDAVALMRSFYLNHEVSPHDETVAKKWRGAILSEEASALFQRVEESAAQLLRYAYEIAPHNNDPDHLEGLRLLRLAHRERLKRGVGWSGHRKTIRGIEEKVRIDDGPPVTVIIKPSAYSYTARARRAKEAARNAANPSGSEEDDDGEHHAPTATDGT